MPIPSISFRLAIVAMLAVLGAWYGYFDQRQHNILLMHFSGSVIARLIAFPLPFAVLAAFIGWNKGYFKKTYIGMAAAWGLLELFNLSMGTLPKHPYLDLEATIMSIMILVALWFAFELFQYVKQYRDMK